MPLNSILTEPSPRQPRVNSILTQPAPTTAVAESPFRTMSMEDRFDRIEALSRERDMMENRHTPEGKTRLREIRDEQRRLSIPLEQAPIDTQRMLFEERGVPQSNITPWEWTPAFFGGKFITTLGRTTLRGAATRAASLSVPMGVTETGAEIAAEAISPNNPYVNLAISLGLGLSVGNVIESIADRKTLKLINKASPNYFSNHLASIVPPDTKNVSLLQRARIKILMSRMDKGDMTALNEARDLLKKFRYKEYGEGAELTQYSKAKDIERTRRQVNRDALKVDFGDIAEKDLEDIQKLAEVEAFQDFEPTFNKLKKKVNDKLAMELYNSHPVVGRMYRVIRGGGFNEARLVRMVGKDIVEKLKKKVPYLIKKDGTVDPIHRAVDFDYSSVDNMIKDFIDMPSYKGVQRSVNAQMKHDWALIYYNEFAERVGGTELRMWERIGGKEMVKRIKNAVRRGAKKQTEEVKKLSDVIKETNFIRRVARRGANAAMEITKAEQRVKALAQALNMKEANKQAKEILGIKGRLKTALKDTGLPEEYQEQIHRYLSPYFPQSALVQPKGNSLRNFLDTKIADDVPLSKLMKNEYGDILELPQMVKNPNDLTITQFKKLDALVNDIRRMGKAQSKIDSIVKAEVVNDYVKRMSKKADKTFKRGYAKGTPREAVTNSKSWWRKRKERQADRMAKWLSDLKRPEYILRELDAWEDMGEAQKMFRAAKFAEDKHFQISKVLEDRWGEILKSYKKSTGKKLSTRFWNKRFYDSKSDFSATREKMITMAAMTGNDHNKQTMLATLAKEDGTPMSEIALNRFLRENMTKEDWKLVKDTWKMTDEMYSMLAETYKRMTGRTLPKVKNYFPIIPDYKFNSKGMDKVRDNIEDVFINLPHMKKVPADVQKRFFHRRVGGADAIRMDFDALAKHFRDVAHTTSHWEVTNDLNKVINDPNFRNMVTENLGEHKYNVLNQWVKDLIKPAPTNSPTLRSIRGNATVAMLGLKLSTALVQPLSMISAIPRVGKRNLTTAIARFARNPIETVRAVNEVSEQMAMRNRAWQRDINELLSSKHADKFKKMGSVDRNVFFSLIRAGDVVGSYTTWYAGWLKGMRKYNGDTNKAIAYADSSVRLTQPQSSIKDLPNIMKDPNEWKRIFTMFYSYYSVLHNQAAELMQRRKFGDASMGEVISALNYMYILPPLVKTLTQERTAATPEAMWKGVATHVAGGLPYVRDIVSSTLMGYDYQLSPVAVLPKNTVELGRLTMKAMQGEDLDPFQVGLTMGTPVGYLTGLPTSQLMTMARGTHAAMNNEDVNIIDVLLKKRRQEE